jgi:glutamyl-tRNA reductase
VAIASLDDRIAAPVVLVVGSGAMAATVVRGLRAAGQAPWVVARHVGHAAGLPGVGAALPWHRLADAVRCADVVVCATSAEHPVVTTALVARAMDGRGRTLTILDLGLPRNVTPDVASVDGVRLVGLEALDVADDATPHAQLMTAAALIALEVSGFTDEMVARAAGPLIAALGRRLAEDCRTSPVQHGVPRTGADDAGRAARLAVAKVHHRLVAAVRAAALAGDEEMLGALAAAFDIGQDDLRRGDGTADDDGPPVLGPTWHRRRTAHHRAA